jgi:hypothetical protein
MANDGPPADWLEDPTGRFQLRYWDGTTYTDWALGFNGEVVADRFATPTPEPPAAASVEGPAETSTEAAEAVGAAVAVETDAGVEAASKRDNTGDRGAGPVGRASVPAVKAKSPTSSTSMPTSSTSARNGSGKPTHAGDAVLSFVSKVTLNSMFDRRLATAFWVPPLLDLIRERPGDPRAMMWLGVRLQELERTKARINGAVPPVSAAGLVLRPVLRPVMRAAASAISSGDGKPASQKVLGSTWQILEPRVRGEAPRVADICLMARAYLAAGLPAKAWELAAVADQAVPARAEAAYILAEAMFECGDHANATTWAHRAAEGGCTLGLSLLRQDTPFRREAWTTTRATRVMPTVHDFWEAKARYYEGASADQLFHFFGPSPLSHA